MKTHSTNYENAFILVAPDTKAEAGRAPKVGAKPTTAAVIFDLATTAPYTHTSDDLIFAAYAARKGIPEADRDEARAAFFAKPQACLRASSLPKAHGWGVHFDAEGRVALVGVDSDDYASFAADSTLTVKPAMRSKRA